jgi:hypothetical protein
MPVTTVVGGTAWYIAGEIKTVVCVYVQLYV